jgi:hypothetical protein
MIRHWGIEFGKTQFFCWHQGDQIGRIFGFWASFPGPYFNIRKVPQLLGYKNGGKATCPPITFDTMRWDAFWVSLVRK